MHKPVRGNKEAKQPRSGPRVAPPRAGGLNAPAQPAWPKPNPARK